MKRFFAIPILIVTLLFAGCQAEPIPVVYIVLSPTPEMNAVSESTVAVTSEVTAEITQVVTEEPTEVVTLTAEPTALPEATTEAPVVTTPPTATALPTETPQRTPLPAGFPTPVTADIQVAEQVFEHGRMFWLQPTGEIWIVVVTAEGRGDWYVYQDTFVDGEPETDPSLTPPEGQYQPERGFGKLWREAPEVREMLGWAITPEFGYVSPYQYNAGGSVNADGAYTAGPGYHVLYTTYGEQFRFNEVDNSWQLGGG